ncbi:MAG: hypothetical protein M3Y86_03335, partial [Verrucomicrobiota bacterium]|nr:hypothetical protein [Verrucomicrobiota bacterium]
MHLPQVHRILLAASRCAQVSLMVSRARNETIVREMVEMGLVEATFRDLGRASATRLGAVTKKGGAFLRAFAGYGWKAWLKTEPPPREAQG